ncbi:Glutathione S-transferase domain protein [mine drainage metagenome]|uniref:Glutathione S-transferase domain protein n=2 Tax=mine drainage metagenome TaxID=410659 RepID=T1BNX2_9ZZZZ
MKLYFSPGACSLSPHIVLHELGLSFEPVQVDLSSKKTKDGSDFRKINPKGYVPALQLDDGAILTEGPAIVQYLADQKPAAGLAPANGTFARYRLQEWLNFISTELHKQFSPLFNPASSDALKQAQQERLAERFRQIVAAMGTAPYLMGDQFTVADAYLYTVLTWTGFLGVDLTPFPALKAYMERVEARPAVRATLAAERAAKKG